MKIVKSKHHKNLEKYTALHNGSLVLEGREIEYQLGYLTELAARGDRKTLRQEISNEAPVLGIDEEIYQNLEGKMYLRKMKPDFEKDENKTSNDGVMNYITTLEAALLCGRTEIVKMMNEEYQLLDMRDLRTVLFFCGCRKTETLQYILDDKTQHSEYISFEWILNFDNEILLQELFQRGCIPNDDVLDNYYQEIVWRNISVEKFKKKLSVRFLVNRGYGCTALEELQEELPYA